MIPAGQSLEDHLYQAHGSNDHEDWVKITMTQGVTCRFTYGTLNGSDVLAFHLSRNREGKDPATGLSERPVPVPVEKQWASRRRLAFSIPPTR